MLECKYVSIYNAHKSAAGGWLGQDRCLPHETEDLDLDPLHPCAHNSRTGKAETGESLRLTGQSRLLDRPC